MMPADAVTNRSDVLAEALQLAALGWRVLPIKPGQKRPPMTAWQDAATNDPAIISNWFRGLYADHGLGVATGLLPTGRYLFVVDVDEHDPAASGSDTLHELEAAHGALPATVEVLTGSDGRHVYLTSPLPIHNDSGRRLGPGLDIRGVGGQVLAPPTIHPNGRPYVWLADHGPTDIEVAEAPAWLLERLLAAPEAPKVAAVQRRDGSVWDVVADDGPAARFNAATTWEELLTADGWTLSHVSSDGEQHWTRPGKEAREGTSATVGWNGQDVLKVFTSSVPWLPQGAYSRFGYHACRHHGGDRSAAAASLRAKASGDKHFTAAQVGDPWPELIPLTDEVEPPPFPLDALPSWIVDHALEVADDLQVAVDLPATLALGALSVAVLGRAKVSYGRSRWTQPLNLYCCVALPPSAGKSPAKAAMFGVLEDLEMRRLQEAATARMIADADRSLLEKQRRNAEERAAKATGDDADAARHDLYDTVEKLARLERVPSGRLLADDATTEALGVALAEAGGAIAVVSAEGGVFDRIAGLYSDKSNFDLYLEAWGGGRYVVDRIKREPISLPVANLCVITTVQPSVLDEVGAKKEFAGRGLTARFLLCKPWSNVGTRDRLKASVGDDKARRAYDARMLALSQRVASQAALVVVEGEASDLFAEWDQMLEHRLAPGRDLEHLAEWVGKLRANVLRLAALLHLADDASGDAVDVDTVERAIALGEYYLAHAVSIAAGWGVDEVVAKAKKVAQWAAREQLREFSVRECYGHPSLRRTIAGPEEAKPVLELLAERGWIRALFDGPMPLGKGGKASPRFEVRPDACGKLSPSLHNRNLSARSVYSARKGGFQHPDFSVSDPFSAPTPVHTARTARTASEVIHSPHEEAEALSRLGGIL